MLIREIFNKDINRNINGVIQVDQNEERVIAQEVGEYVVTGELREHFRHFFQAYAKAFCEPTNGIGVWISGFFGSGKSHFLKMLSYLLENHKIGATDTVSMFAEKFADAPDIYELIQACTQYETQTILFNIDVEGSINKDNTAVMRVFAKMFYRSLGFADDLSIARFEFYLEKEGKTQAFRQAYFAKTGKEWVQQRKAFLLNRSKIIATMVETLGYAEADAIDWFDNKTKNKQYSDEDFSIKALSDDIKWYLDTKPENFRLLFMIDEVGQYVGINDDYLLNLQSLVEKIGSTCGNKVWVMCTGQQALDDIIKLRVDKFSRIIARFETILSLSSASADEVIQKRILEKTEPAAAALQTAFAQKDSVLRNLFTFSSETVGMVRGFEQADEFSSYYPFVPYQFYLLQRVFTEIRLHGNIGKHQSGSERSMLSAFKEAAQQLQEQEIGALAPFYLFYDTIKAFLDNPIRLVIDNCEKAVKAELGLEEGDAELLKLLYLLKYVGKDVPANLDNLVILMAEQIDVDKKLLRERLARALSRLENQNYIDNISGVYRFLTNEEQDVQKEINNTAVEPVKVVGAIGTIIVDNICKNRKVHKGKKDFDYDVRVDDTNIGQPRSEMILQFYTNINERSNMRFMNSDNKVIIDLAELDYYKKLETAQKIRTYVKKNNINDMTDSLRGIVSNYQSKASQYEREAVEMLNEAIAKGDFYVAGDKADVTGDVHLKIDTAMQKLVECVYNKYSLLDYQPDSESALTAILQGQAGVGLGEGFEQNDRAADEMQEHLQWNLNISKRIVMADLLKRYQSKPFGWRELDVVAVVAKLLYEQRAQAKYQGKVLKPEDKNLAELLRKRAAIGELQVSCKVSASATLLKNVHALLAELLRKMDVPLDEDGLVRYIIEHFSELRKQYKEMQDNYHGNTSKYPDYSYVQQAVGLLQLIINQQNDSLALLNSVKQYEDALFTMRDRMEDICSFFEHQREVFDAAVKTVADYTDDNDYLDEASRKALDKMRLYTKVKDNFNYNKIAELPKLNQQVQTYHRAKLAEKRAELLASLATLKQDFLAEVDKHKAACTANAELAGRVQQLVENAQAYFGRQETSINSISQLIKLEGKEKQLLDTTTNYLTQLQLAVQTKPKEEPKPAPAAKVATPATPVQKQSVKSCNKWNLVTPATIASDEDIENYVQQVRQRIKLLKGSADVLEIK